MGRSAREGSGVKLGEMECQILYGAGLTNVVQEFRDRQNPVEVNLRGEYVDRSG